MFYRNFPTNAASLFSLHISKNDSDKTTAATCLLAGASGCQLDWDSYLTIIIKLFKISKIRIVFRESLTE